MLKEISKGEGRTKVNLSAYVMGKDLVVCVYNEMAHIGAVAVGEWDKEHERASVSVVTRLGHKDDAIAQRAAYLISKTGKMPVCVIAGVHLEQITIEEIEEIIENAEAVVEKFVKGMGR